MNTQSIDVKHLPVICNVDAVVGDDYAMDLVIRLDGTPLVWTGVTPTYAITTVTGDAPPSNINWTVTTPSAGLIRLALTGTNTTTLGANTYNWWLSLTISDKKRTYLKGRLRLLSKTVL